MLNKNYVGEMGTCRCPQGPKDSKFLPSTPPNIDFDAEKEINGIVSWIKSFNMKGAVVGISGGKDSTVVAGLLVKALGKNNVFGVLMPNGHQKDLADSYKVVEHLGINHKEVNIGDAFGSLINEIGLVTKDSEINIAPRLRMTTLYAVAQTLGYRVAGTGNASEIYVGYTTKWGDSVSDFNPIGNYTKEEVVLIGLALGLPESLVRKVPNDGLSGETDEDKLGVTYAQIQEYIKTRRCKDNLANNIITTKHRLAQHKFEPVPLCPRTDELEKKKHLDGVEF